MCQSTFRAVYSYICFAEMKVLSPKKSAEFIVDKARDVSVDQDGIRKVADLVQKCYHEGSFSFGSWKEHPLHPQTADESAAQWIFLVDTLNFSFWSEDDECKYMVELDGVHHTGYWSLCAAVNRAIKEGIPILDAKFCRDISLEQVKYIFRSSTKTEVPLLIQRHEAIKDYGRVLCNMFGGSFVNCILNCNKSCQKLLSEVIESFPSFRDEGTFEGIQVSFYKRAQILVADLWACFAGKGFGEFHDIGTLTAFADYRVPQVLVFFGALHYSDHLNQLLGEGKSLQNGDREEMEIRGATIHACELVREDLKQRSCEDPKLDEVNSVLVDFCLWNYRRKHANALKPVPFHRVRTIYY